MPTRKLCRAASKPLSLGQAWQAGAVQIARIVQLAAPDGKWLLLLALSSRRLAKPGDAILPQPVPAQRSGGYSRRRRMMRLGEHQDHHIAPPDERVGDEPSGGKNAHDDQAKYREFVVEVADRGPKAMATHEA